jgi:hypothetical protein
MCVFEKARVHIYLPLGNKTWNIIFYVLCMEQQYVNGEKCILLIVGNKIVSVFVLMFMVGAMLVLLVGKVC